MEEDEYRSTYHQFNQTRCAFEKTILNRRCGCKYAHKFCLAEREGVACQARNHQQQCREFLQATRQRALFSLKLTQLDGNLPHAKEVRLQLGGLIGLSELLDGAEPGAITDVNGLLTRARRRYESWQTLPFNSLIRAIGRVQGRKRRYKTLAP